MKILHIFLQGIAILIGAILLNAFGSTLGLTSWFAFFKDQSNTSLISYFWLFILYPFGLGLVGHLSSKYISINRK